VYTPIEVFQPIVRVAIALAKRHWSGVFTRRLAKHERADEDASGSAEGGVRAVRGWNRNEIEAFSETDDTEVRFEGGKGC
jgi:hypothetical protein